MAKKRGPSIHSRAARRATSPGIDTDKSLKDVQPPKRNTAIRPSVLAIHQSAGVQKKSKRGRNLSSKARRRQEKNAEMAEAVLERTSTKVERSKGRGRSIQQRAKAWEDINRVAEEEKLEKEDGDADDDDDADKGSKNKKTGDADDGWETDEDMEVAAKAPSSGVPSSVEAVLDDDDLIL